jgi:hypothetical protein
MLFEPVKKAPCSMKSKMSMLLAVSVVLLGVGAAVANQPSQEHVGTLKANIGGVWTPISESQRYSCSENLNMDCVARFDEQDQIIPTTVIKGEYAPL